MVKRTLENKKVRIVSYEYPDLIPDNQVVSMDITNKSSGLITGGMALSPKDLGKVVDRHLEADKDIV